MKVRGQLKQDSDSFVLSNGGTQQTTLKANASSTSHILTLPALTGADTVLSATSTATVTNKTLVVASNTITTAASGNLAATELNAALAELQTDVDTRALDSDLTTHEADTTTHGTTGDIVGTDDAQALTNKTLVVASNTVTTAASGNLAATELNAALAELQGDIDTRALDSDLAAHEANVSNPHSVTAAQVLPSQTSNGGKVLQTDGSNTSWVSVATTDSQPPIGSIVAYNPGYYTAAANVGFTVVGPSGNTVADVNTYLPDSWRVCDGSALDDAGSPIWVGASRYLPDVSDSRFLMGATAGGSTGGANSSAHTHSVPAHYHALGTGADLAIGASGAHTHNVWDNSTNSGSGHFGFTRAAGGAVFTSETAFSAVSNTHSHATGDFTGRIGLVTGGVDGNAAMTSGAASATENRPAYLSTFYIVRVK